MSSLQSHVFTNDKGERFKFFVEAAAVRDRAALIRKIVKNGGTIVNTALDADILLAESNTKEALELFEAWRNDKILLSTRWISRCLDENAFLGSDRGWAGYELSLETLRQGIADNDASEEEEEEPEKPTRSRRTVSSSQAAKTSRSKQVSSKTGSYRLRSNTTSSNKSHQRHPSNVERTGEQRHPSTSANPHISTPQSRSKDTPQNSQNPALPTNTPLSTSLPQSSQMALQQSLLASLLSNALQSPQQQVSPDQHAPGQFPALPQLAPFLTPTIFQQLLAQQFAVNQQALNSQPAGLSEQSGLGNIGQQSTGTDVPPSSNQGSSSRATPEDVGSGFVSDSSSVASEEEEVERSISRRSGARRRVISDSSSEHEIQTAIRSKPLKAQETVPKMKSGIFVNAKGVSQTFYVMIDLKNRKDLLRIIRKHNGAIVSQMDDADYIILNIRSTQFQKALDILPVHKIAISPTWIEECEKANKLLAVAPYVIDVTSGVGRGAARKKPFSSKARISTSEDDKNKAGSSPLRMQDTTPKPTPKPAPKPAPKLAPKLAPKPASKPTPKPTPSNVAPKVQPQALTNPPRPRSLSPFPPTDVEPVGSDGKFTENDRAWFLTYVRFKLQHNPGMTYDALIHAVGRKAPYHSTQSWDIAWRTMWPNDMRILKQEVDALVKRRTLALPSSSNPSTTQETQNELIFSENSKLLPSQVSRPGWLPNNAPTWNTLQGESSSTSPLKRKENPTEEPVDTVALEQQNKRIKTTQGNIIDVDS